MSEKITDEQLDALYRGEPVEEIAEEPKGEEDVIEPEKDEGAEVVEVAKEVVEEKVDEPTEPEPVVEEPVREYDEAEGSRLGRKLKAQEDTIGVLEEKLERMEKLFSESNITQEIKVPDSLSGVESDEPLTAQQTKDLLGYERERERQATEARERKEYESQVKYENSYLAHADQYEKESGDPDAKAILNMVVAKDGSHNWKHSDDPEKDFRLNLAEAKVAYYESKSKKKSVPGRKETPKDALGVGGDTSTTEKSVDVELPANMDDKTKMYVAHLMRQGKTKEEIAGWLKED
jgi:hypothetical protein